MRYRVLDTPALHLAYEESGPKRGEPLLLVHGWPDSPRTWDGVLPSLHAAGYRTIAPFLRGYGPSRFRDPWFGKRPRRTGQPVALAQDVLDLADRLKLQTFDMVGHDWGARAGYAIAAVAPRRLRSLVAISVPFQPVSEEAPELRQAQAFWYQWLLCTGPGERSFREDAVRFCRAQWDAWSPAGWYREEELREAARSWGGKDFVEVVLHSYRSRWGHAEKDPRYGAQQARMEAVRELHTPTLLIQGAADRCLLPETTDGAERYFRGPYRRVLMEGVGHFPQREDAAQTAAEVLRHLQARTGDGEGGAARESGSPALQSRV